MFAEEKILKARFRRSGVPLLCYWHGGNEVKAGRLLFGEEKQQEKKKREGKKEKGKKARK